jgi:hypothetical protein
VYLCVCRCESPLKAAVPHVSITYKQSNRFALQRVVGVSLMHRLVLLLSYSPVMPCPVHKPIVELQTTETRSRRQLESRRRQELAVAYSEMAFAFFGAARHAHFASLRDALQQQDASAARQRQQGRWRAKPTPPAEPSRHAAAADCRVQIFGFGHDALFPLAAARATPVAANVSSSPSTDAGLRIEQTAGRMEILKRTCTLDDFRSTTMIDYDGPVFDDDAEGAGIISYEDCSDGMASAIAVDGDDRNVDFGDMDFDGMDVGGGDGIADFEFDKDQDEAPTDDEACRLMTDDAIIEFLLPGSVPPA